MGFEGWAYLRGVNCNFQQSVMRAKGSKSTAGAIPRGVVSRAVKDVLSSRAEHKQITAVNAYADLATAGAVSSLLQAIGQGDDINARSGDQILVEKMKLRIVFKNTAGAGSGNTARVLLVSDTLNQGSVPAVTDILASADVLSGFTQTAAQQHRYKVLLDHRVATVSNTNAQVVCVDRELRLNRKVFYTAASGATSHGRNAIFILFITDAASAGSIQVKWSHQTSYLDV